MIRMINIPSDTMTQVFERIAEEFPDQMEKGTNYIANKILGFWKNTAITTPENKQGGTSGWGKLYAETIIMEESTGGKGAKVYVDEKHPSYRYVKLVEEGVTVWSIKNALLKGKAARRNKALYGTVFVRVPFRWRTPSMSEPGRGTKFAGMMNEDVYEKVKGGEALGKEYGKMAGMVKMGGPLHSQYMTFRTVSEKSKGWFFPSKPGYNVFERVKKRTEQMLDAMVKRMIIGYLRNLQKDMS